MKVKDVLELFNELKRMENIEASAKFSFAVMKNIALTEYEVEGFKEIALKPMEGGEEYRKERMVLVEKYVGRDENNNLKSQVSPNGQSTYVFEDDNEKLFKKEMDIVDKKHKDFLQKVEERRKELDKMMEQSVKIELVKVPLDFFPDKISPRQMKILTIMLDEEKIK
jgi:adenylate kinase family enzyme